MDEDRVLFRAAWGFKARERRRKQVIRAMYPDLPKPIFDMQIEHERACEAWIYKEKARKISIELYPDPMQYSEREQLIDKLICVRFGAEHSAELVDITSPALNGSPAQGYLRSRAHADFTSGRISWRTLHRRLALLYLKAIPPKDVTVTIGRRTAR